MDNRQAFVMKLKEGCKEEYQKRHAAIWPELKALLSESGVYDYTIFLDESTHLFFAFQRARGETATQSLGTDSIVQKWWAHMAPLMETHEDNSPISIPLEEVFHMD